MTTHTSLASTGTPHIEVHDVTLAYGDFVIQRDLSFGIERGEIFVIMGGSGCGKTTVLRSIIGLKSPSKGQIRIDGNSIWDVDDEKRNELKRNMGVLFQQGALWSSMTLAENVALALQMYTEIPDKDIREICSLKLALVGLAGFEDFYPNEISGGMRKRAGLARAMALDPDILCFDEPSAGLDPISSKLLDDLILELRDSLGTTIIVVTHELASIFAIADNSVFLDANTKTQLAIGNPKTLRDECDNFEVRNFLARGEARE
jgi:phospholipid/cholesterol/gamma-HCH transport system ATP-binding protein